MINKISSVTIIGYGSQAKTWASNLSESGVEINIALRLNSSSKVLAKNNNFNVFSYEEKSSSGQLFESDIIVILTPDHTHLEIINKIQNSLSSNSLIIFAHGFSVVKDNLPKKFKHLNFGLLAPKAIASEMRLLYKRSEKFPGAYSVEHCKNMTGAEKKLLEISKMLGMSPPTKVSFEEETICDLFSEQSLLCSLIPYGIRFAFEALEKKDINPEMAFNECLYESKLIIQTIEKLGFKRFFEIISPNALYGGQKAQSSTEFQSLRTLYTRLIDDISNNTFYEEVDKTDFDKLRTDVIEDWSNSKISSAWEKFNQNKKM
jgi:ketol-acid reductoisomerase